MRETGPLTFLFTDIEGSSALWEQATATMEHSVARQEAILTNSIRAHRGRVVKTLGDGIYAVFPSASDGLAAALSGMKGVVAEPWPEETPIKIRMGLHTGQAVEREDDFYGPAVNRTARLEAAAHGGQIVLSSVTAELAAAGLPKSVQLLDVGEVRLRGLAKPERVSQVLADDLPSEFPPLRGVTAPNNLPAPTTSFLGRDEEMNQVMNAVEESRLVTIVGFGGTGKTRIAIEAAVAATADHPDGVWFVDLAPVQSPELVAQTLASTLGVEEEPEVELGLTLSENLMGQRVLIVIDNCEHVLDEVASLVAPLIAGTDQLHVLTTSRQRLNVPGELVFDLAPLPTSGGSATIGPAVQLFLDRARSARSGFTAVGEELAAVRDICAHLDGIPLAIELAAARIRILRPTEIAARLSDRFQLLSDGSRTALPRQQTLRALVDWSFELLSDEEKAVFDRSSVFAGNFTIKAAEEVCSGGGVSQERIFNNLASLADQSLALVDNSAEEVRFILLETLRAYGAEQLEAAGETDVYRSRHATLFATAVSGADERLKGSDQGDWHKRFEADQPDLLQALAWLTENQPQAALAMAAELGRFWYRKGMTTPGRDLTAAALAAAGKAPTVARGRALGWLSYFVDVLGDADEAWELTLEALDIAERIGDDEGMAFALNGLGNRADNAGRPREAGEYWQQAIAALERANASVAAPMFNLGICLVELGDLDQARPLATRLAGLGEEQKDPWASAKGKLLSGYIAHGEGRLNEAEQDAKTAEEMFLEQGGVFDAAEAVVLSCAVAELRSDVPEAMHQFERAKEFLKDTNAFEGAEAYLLQSRIALRDGDLLAVSESLQAAYRAGRGSTNPIHLVSLLHESARLATLFGRHEEGLQLAGAAQAQRQAAELQMVSYQAEEQAEVEARAAERMDAREIQDLMAQGSALEPAAALELANSLLDEIS